MIYRPFTRIIFRSTLLLGFLLAMFLVVGATVCAVLV